MNQYLFLDIDNTLYSGKSGRVPDSALLAIQKARENGSRVFLCTGRSRAEAMKYHSYPVDGFIFSSGSLCIAEEKIIFDQPIDPKQVEVIAQLVRNCDMGVLMGGAKQAYLDQKCFDDVKNYFSRPEADEETKQRDMAANGMTLMECRDMADPIYKMGASKKHNRSFEPLISILPHPFRLIQTLSSPEGDFGDISDATIMKKDGIRHVLDYYHAGLEEAVGIGDSMNDLDMIEACGIGIAMGNGTEEIKQAADWVTSDIDEDGIYNAFLHIGVI